MQKRLSPDLIERMLHNVERVAHIGSWILDIKANQLVWSDEIFRMFEVDPNKFEASYEAFLEAIHPDDREMVNDAYMNSLQTKQPYRIEHRLQMKDGTVKAVEEWCETTFDNEGNPIISIGTVQDITQRWEAQEKMALQSLEILKRKQELQKLNKNLETMVSERTKELEDTLKKLNITQKYLIENEKMAALGSLVAGVAHEINTPIGLGITGISHFIDETKKLKELYENEQMGEEEFQNYLENAMKLANITYINLKRTAELVKSFKQISVDQISEKKREFGLKVYIDEILLSLQNKLKNTHVKIELKGCEHVSIYSYPGAFSQIVTNLIINSLVHGFKNRKMGTITMSCEVKEDRLIFIYEDDGNGIKDENIEKIFHPFFTTNRDEGGSGLGLNIVYNIVRHQLEGTIHCNSKENEGVEFIIIIPLDEKKEGE